MTNDGGRFMQIDMEIEEGMRDVVADEFTSITFECKMRDCSEPCNSYRWYKDGKRIEASQRIKICYDGKWHRLEITSITSRDHGVYVLLMSSSTSQLFSTANLYVKQTKERSHDNVLFLNPNCNPYNAIRHLRCTKVLVGDTIELEAIFNADVLDDYLWYKGNNPLQVNERTIVLNDKRITTLSILCAKETDTGIYQVVAKSEYGIASSFATVIVINTDLNTLNGSEVAPSIDELLPEELEVNEGEEVRLMCKATYDVNTSIHWSRNGVNIQESKTSIIEYYNNRYICLRIMNISMKESGEYSIIMQNDITGFTDTSSCFLTVNHTPNDSRDSVKLKTILEPMATCIGSRISFTCSYILDDPKFYFVIWYVGHYRVERTNHQFQVLQKGGDFYLIIKQVELGMAGEVTCELRKALPNRKSILINNTSTSLTIVPLTVIDRELNKTTSIRNRNVFYKTNSKVIIPIITRRHELNGIQKTVISSNGAKNVSDTDETTMIITYCRLDDDSFYFDILNDQDDMVNLDHLIVYEKLLDNECSKQYSKLIVIEWYKTPITETEFSQNNTEWYLIEIEKTCDVFIEAGVSSFPMFELKDPLIEQIMKFRITAIDSLQNANESRICILPAIDELKIANKMCDIKPMEEFDSLFKKTGDVIGCGAFGSVVLVHDCKGEFYAAKILKTRTQKKRDTAVREYEIMKNLKHPKLVELYDTFTARETFVLVMDYLWGGELFDRIVEEEHIKEVDVVPYVQQICEALQYLHNHKIAHLDLKPENIICLSPNSRQVKLIDFGLARVLDENLVTKAIYGTRDYVAPEVLNFEQLTLACDMWSLGVVTYMLLSGVMPFSGDSWPERSANITRANYNYSESAFKEISDLAKDFVDHLLLLQPNRRMKASVALTHKWITQGPPKGSKSGHMKRTRQNLKSYLANYRARWQRAGNVMIAAHRLRNAGSQRNTLDVDRVSPRVT